MIDIVEGDSSTFAAYAFGRPNIADMEWCNQFAQQKMATYDPWLQDHIRQSGPDIYNTYNYQNIYQISKAITSQDEADWFKDEIRHIKTVTDVQNAPGIMVQWIMACPQLRERYIDQTIAGYDESYVDQYDVGKVGADHYLYRLAVEGLLLENKDGEHVATEWHDEIFDDRLKLTLYDQTLIQQSWAVALEALAEGDVDPTSRYNAAL